MPLKFFFFSALSACNLANRSVILSTLLLTSLDTFVTLLMSDTCRFLVCGFVPADIIYFLTNSQFKATSKQ